MVCIGHLFVVFMFLLFSGHLRSMEVLGKIPQGDSKVCPWRVGLVSLLVVQTELVSEVQLPHIYKILKSGMFFS